MYIDPTESIIGFVKAKFPYPRQKGDYPQIEYLRVQPAAGRWRTLIYLTAPIGLISGAAGSICLQDLKGKLLHSIFPGNIIFTYSGAELFIAGMLISFGLLLFQVQLLCIRALQGERYDMIVDLISARDNIDLKAISIFLLRRLPLFGLAIFILSMFCYTSIGPDQLYTMDFGALPHKFKYSEIEQVYDYQYPPRSVDDTLPGRRCFVKTASGKTFEIFEATFPNKCAARIAEKVGVPVVIVPVNTAE